MTTKQNAKKAGYWAIGAILVASIVWSFVPDPIAQDFAVAKFGDIEVTVHSDGRTRVREDYIVSAPFSGRMLRLEIKPGDEVVAGETVVAVMEPQDPAFLDARALAEAKGRVSAANAALQASMSMLEQSKAELDFARRELARADGLVQGNTISSREKEEYKLAVSRAETNYAAAISARKVAQYELEVAEAAILPPSKGVDSMGFVEVKAPVSGSVLRLYHKSEGVVAAGQPLLSLGNHNDLEIVTDMLSIDVVKVAVGDRAIIDNWGGPYPLAGVVRRIEPSGFTKISALGIEEQRVNVLVELADAPERWKALGDGYRVEVFCVYDEAKNVLLIPVSSLFRHQGGWFVFKVIDGEAVLSPVTVGLKNDVLAQIKTGVEAGDTVIAHPSNEVDDETPVRQRE